MKTVLITSKDFGTQLDEAHYKQLINYFENNGWRIVWNSSGRAMSARDIIDTNTKHRLDAIAVYSSSDEINQEVFEHCQNLKVISRHGVGVENIDTIAAQKKGVQIKTTADMPGFETVADLTFALMLMAARKVHIIDAQMRANKWYRPISSDVWGKTLGIIGLGRIGKAVVRRAQGFNMNILVHTGHPDMDYFARNGLSACSKDELVAKADFITLHCAMNEKTRNIMDAKEFFLMKPTAYLINTARSGLVNQIALLDALKNKKIAGVAVDVFEQEPVVNDPLITENFDRVVATSHVGSYTFESIQKMDFLVAENIVQAV
jgi:D-3-phosphoglycerate dehydrogenase